MGFFPQLPIRIPFSPGIAHWWDPFWWLFQIIVMTVLLLSFRKVALQVDEHWDDPKPEPQELRSDPRRR